MFVANRGAAYLAGTSRSVGRGWSSGHFLPDLVKDTKLSRKQTAQIITEDTHKVENLLRDMVRNNIIYYDPTLAIFYPQGRSLELGIKLYFA